MKMHVTSQTTLQLSTVTRAKATNKYFLLSIDIRACTHEVLKNLKCKLNNYEFLKLITLLIYRQKVTSRHKGRHES